MEATPTPTVSTVPPAYVERAVAVIVIAFAADPVARWTYPDARQYLALFPPLIRGFGGSAFPQGTARQVDNYAGAALWLPPSTEPDQAALAASLPAGREAELTAVFDTMARYPSEPSSLVPASDRRRSGLSTQRLWRGAAAGNSTPV